MSVGGLVHFIFYDLLALLTLGVEPIHPSEHSQKLLAIELWYCNLHINFRELPIIFVVLVCILFKSVCMCVLGQRNIIGGVH